MTRSASRTEETSGLATTIASSAKYMAIWAPFSMPAGESQMMYSKPMLPQVADHLAHALGGQRLLVPGLRRGQDVQGVDPLVPDQRLMQLRLAPDDVDEVVDHAALDPEHEVQVPQADIEVDGDGLLAHQGDAGGDVGAVVVLPTPPLPEVMTTTFDTFASMK